MITKDFSSYCLKDESILKQVNQHLIIHGFFLFIFFIWIISYGLCLASLWKIEIMFWNGFLWSVICLSFIIFITYLVISTISHYSASCIITNKRIILIDWISLFATWEKTIQLWEITKIQSESRGFFATLFSYGTITICYNSWCENEFTFSYVSHPGEIIAFIHTLKEKVTNTDEKVAK